VSGRCHTSSSAKIPKIALDPLPIYARTTAQRRLIVRAHANFREKEPSRWPS